MIPQTRTDLFLAKITGEDVALPVPQTRFEMYLANVAGESYELPAPNSRATLYLAKILGQDVELPEPQTRSELYLASIAGMSVQLPEAPQTREEWYLAKWAEDAAYVVITGNPVTFNAVAAKLRQLKIAFSPVQEGSGDPSPENERPIRGWTGVNVWQAGVNLWDKANVEDGYVDDADGVIKGNAQYKHTGFIPVKPNTQYYVKTEQTQAAWGAWYDADKRYISGVAQYQLNPTITAPANAAYVNLTVQGTTGNPDTFGLNYPATVTEFVPYSGQLIQVVFPDGETFYSGWVDLITGDGIATHRDYDLGNLNWTYNSGALRFDAVGSTSALGAKSMPGSEVPIAWCTIYAPVKYNGNYGAAGPDNVFFFDGSLLRVRNKAYTDAATFKTAMSGVMLVYELATPIPFHVDPQQISSLAGANTMWSDANGPLTVEYRKDGNVSDAEALGILLGGRYTPATGPEDVPDSEALRIITGR